MDNLETQETLSPRDRMWKNGQSGDTGNIKHKRQNEEKWTTRDTVNSKRYNMAEWTF
jgi:hypothetical protein